ncbi:MAG: hypothetical protein JNM36_01125 [Chitinophagales bacterium]|nr:hypothetical protein [Chitinophagales bacterium]
MGVSLRVGLLWASLCFGAALLSALANATLRIPNALRHSNKNILIFYSKNSFFPKNRTHTLSKNNGFAQNLFLNKAVI